MKNFAIYIVNILLKENLISPEQKDIYIYGVETLTYTILSTAALLLIGICFNRFLEVLSLVFIFYCLQSTGGGYHANSHSRCFICMVLGTLFYLCMMHCLHNKLMYILFGICSLIVLWYYPLVLHPNKAYLAAQHHNLVFKSKRLTALFGIAWLLSIAVDSYILISSFSLSLFMSMTSRSVAVFQNHNKGLVFKR